MIKRDLLSAIVVLVTFISPAQPIESHQAESQATAELLQIVSRFTIDPGSVTGGEIRSLNEKAKKLSKGTAIETMCALVVAEYEWFESKGAEDKQTFENILKQLVLELSVLKADTSADTTSFQRISTLCTELRRVNPASSCAIFYFATACDVQFKRRVPKETRAIIDSEISYRSTQFGANAALTCDVYRLLARIQFDSKQIADAKKTLERAIKSCSKDDVFLAGNLCWTLNELAKSSMQQEDGAMFEWCREQIGKLAEIANDSTPIKEAIENLNGLAANYDCDVAYMIARGKAIDPNKVRTQDGILRLCDYALGLREGGEVEDATELLSSVFERLKTEKNDSCKFVGFVLSGLLASENRWEDASDVIEAMRGEDQDSIAGLSNQIMSIWISVNMTPKQVTYEEIDSVRKLAATTWPDNAMLRRWIDLTEAQWRLAKGQPAESAKILESIRRTDVRNREKIINVSGAERVRLEIKVAQALKNKSLEAKGRKELEEFDRLVAKRRETIRSHGIK